MSERALITERLRPISSNVSSAPSRQLQTKAKVKCDEDVRAELLGTTQSQEGNNAFLLWCHDCRLLESWEPSSVKFVSAGG